MSHSDYWQLEGAEQPVELRYNAQARSFRLNGRLYFLERAGFFQSKMRITTEYNVKAGECYFNKSRFAGILHFENSKYDFKVEGDQVTLSEKNNPPFAQITITSLDNLDHFEFVALLFTFINYHAIVKRQSSIVNGT